MLYWTPSNVASKKQSGICSTYMYVQSTQVSIYLCIYLCMFLHP